MYFTLTYIPKARLKSNQMMTIGANVLASLVVPKGWTRKITTRMAQETPTINELEISSLTTDNLCHSYSRILCALFLKFLERTLG